MPQSEQLRISIERKGQNKQKTAEPHKYGR